MCNTQWYYFAVKGMQTGQATYRARAKARARARARAKAKAC